jgi:glutamate synthase domain-containing protein 3
LPPEAKTMIESAPTVPEPFDLQTADLITLNTRLRGLEDATDEVKIVGATGQNGLATGLRHSIKIHISGNVGAYFALLNAGADLDIAGDATAACGHSMSSGSILVRGHAGHSLAAFARGGFIGVHGSAKYACALGLNGADVVVRQSVGPRAAQGMRAGNLVLGSDAGVELGKDCQGGTIYLRGDAASIAETLREVRMRESDAMRLGLLLVRAGIKGAAKDFRVYRAHAESAKLHA